MADFAVKKRKGFEFTIEDDPHTYVIPAMSGLSFEDVSLLSKADKETDIVKRGKVVREFILKFAPDLRDLSDMVFFEIYSAYADFLGNSNTQVGESRASQDS